MKSKQKGTPWPLVVSLYYDIKKTATSKIFNLPEFFFLLYFFYYIFFEQL
jgi:hypothetical protein